MLTEAQRKIGKAMLKGATLRRGVLFFYDSWWLNFPDGSQRRVNSKSAINMLVAGMFGRTARYFPLKKSDGSFAGYYSLEHKLSPAGRSAITEEQKK